MMFNLKNGILLLMLAGLVMSCKKENKGAFPYTVTDSTKDRELSEAFQRSFFKYSTPRPEDNELFTSFKYTPLKGFDYHNGDGTVSRRDPSKVIKVNNKYYMWYTHRETSCPPVGPKLCNDTLASTDWDLAEIWYATSKDGFIWEEQGVAVPRPPKPNVGWRSVSTPDILVWKGKYYLYYQGFMEPSGKKGDYCPVTASYSDSPNGPWTPSNEEIIPNGAKGEWDQYAIHDPYPLVHNGKIYLYYKSAFNRPENLWIAAGLAISDSPLKGFKKHPLNPVLNSGHEVCLFPFKEGVAAIVIKDGAENNTIQYADDWVNFDIASYVTFTPNAPAPYVADAFTDTKDGRGITWGIQHFTNVSKNWQKNYSILSRFDCDLSLDYAGKKMKNTRIVYDLDTYFKQKPSKELLKKIKAASRQFVINHK